jgi:hypothetical protein
VDATPASPGRPARPARWPVPARAANRGSSRSRRQSSHR